MIPTSCRSLVTFLLCKIFVYKDLFPGFLWLCKQIHLITGCFSILESRQNGWPESRVGPQWQWGIIWVVVQIDRRYTGRQDINHAHSHDLPVQPVLLVERTVAHRRPIHRIFRLKTEKMKTEKLLKAGVHCSEWYSWCTLNEGHKLCKSFCTGWLFLSHVHTCLHDGVLLSQTFPCQASRIKCGGIQ